jgi:uncharacterized membrane protein (DUF485 family)
VITVGAKLWLGVAGFAVAAIVAWELFSGGERVGLLVLLGLAVAATIVGTLLVWMRDGEVTPAGDAEERATTAAATSGPLPAPWPAIGAFGVAVTVVGLAAGGALLYAGFGIVAIAVVEWMVQGWAERATPDPVENTALRNRIMYPVEIPLLGLIIVGVVLVAFSRVLLALPKEGSTVTAIAVAATILLVAALVATRPRISSTVLTVVLLLGAVALLGGGIVGAIAGERDIEEHETEAHETETPPPETRPNTQDPNPNAPPETTGGTTEVQGP